MINETLETAGFIASAAALEQSYIWTMSSAPYTGLAAGKGLVTTGVLNMWGYGVGAGIANIGRRFGLSATGNVHNFLAGGSLYSSTLGFDPGNLGKSSGVDTNTLTKRYRDYTKGAQMAGQGGGNRAKATLRAQEGLTSHRLKAKHLKFAGRLAGGLAIANLVGTLASPLIYSAGRGLQMINDIARQPMAAFNSADWGNQLGSAFMTSQAVTERQRAQQILQQTGIVGHGSMGKEANMMHG